MAICRSCKADVRFLNHGISGKRMIFDAKPYTAWVWDTEKETVVPLKALTPHHATCPNADEWRKRKKGDSGS